MPKPLQYWSQGSLSQLKSCDADVYDRAMCSGTVAHGSPGRSGKLAQDTPTSTPYPSRSAATTTPMIRTW